MIHENVVKVTVGLLSFLPLTLWSTYAYIFPLGRSYGDFNLPLFVKLPSKDSRDALLSSLAQLSRPTSQTPRATAHTYSAYTEIEIWVPLAFSDLIARLFQRGKALRQPTS